MQQIMILIWIPFNMSVFIDIPNLWKLLEVDIEVDIDYSYNQPVPAFRPAALSILFIRTGYQYLTTRNVID